MPHKRWFGPGPGIPDDMFIRGDVPMTKEEVREITMCKARVHPASIVYDIGAGTGSLSIEAALLAPEGQVYAIERDKKAISLIQKNILRFGVRNIDVINGIAPGVLETLPPADRIFIGGSGGYIEDILKICDQKLVPGGRLVINAITLDTIWKAINFYEQSSGYKMDVTCVNVAKLLTKGNVHMFKGLNPIYIIVAEKPALSKAEDDINKELAAGKIECDKVKPLGTKKKGIHTIKSLTEE